jgi:hypothetical protein
LTTLNADQHVDVVYKQIRAIMEKCKGSKGLKHAA